MDLHSVQLDYALFDILGTSGGDNGAEGHGRECKAVDEEKEGVALHVVVEDQLPLQFVIMELQRKRAFFRQIFAAKIRTQLGGEHMAEMQVNG